ncbi:MAG TPA: hypothetical protein VN674_09060 [Gemmatimonadales bacterium]|nr:hypothetical protein [Gemmatimonadales bacterium]
MERTIRLRVTLHGAVVILIGLFCGFPTVVESDSERYWHTAHEALILTGTLMLAVSAVMSHLVLAKREALGLFWALLATGYGLSVGTVLQGILGQHAFGPSSSPMVMIAFIANAIGIGGSVIATALVVMGAGAALKASPND